MPPPNSVASPLEGVPINCDPVRHDETSGCTDCDSMPGVSRTPGFDRFESGNSQGHSVMQVDNAPLWRLKVVTDADPGILVRVALSVANFASGSDG